MRGSMPSKDGSPGRGHPTLFNFAPAWVDHPDGGGYPISFLGRAYKTFGGGVEPDRVLHLCSGSMRVGVTVDCRLEMKPAVVADVTALPFADESFDWIMADPPYSEGYADSLYGTKDKYPTPGTILKEASRVLRVGGQVGVLHFQVPMHRKPLKMVGVWGVTTGAGYAIRAWSVFRKEAKRGE